MKKTPTVIPFIEPGRERTRGLLGMQGYKVFSRDIRYMEAQDPLRRRGGGRGWLDHCLFEMELDVSCRFGFCWGKGRM